MCRFLKYTVYCMKQARQKPEIEKRIIDFLEYLEIDRGRSLRTIRNYHFYLNRFAKWAQYPRPEMITRELVHKYRLWLNRSVEGRSDDTLRKSTQNYHLIALRSFLKYLSKNEIPSLPPEQVELARQVQRIVEFLEPDELERLLAQPTKDETTLITLRDKAMLELLFSTGLRVSEAAALEITDVNLEKDEFTIRGKGDKPRLVFLSERAKNAIKVYLEKRKDLSEHMFVAHDRAKGGRDEVGSLTPRSVQRIVDRYTRLAGITKHVTPHTMRHTFATDLLMSGADIRAVQSLLGHESITTTQIYTHVTNKHLRDIHKKHHGKSPKSTEE